MNPRTLLSFSAIAAVLLLGIGYMTVGVLHVDPRRAYFTAELRLENSGGLGVDSPVLLTGIQIGRAESVDKQAHGVRVRLRIDDRYRVPLASDVRIEQLSALGEPYLEFAPRSAAGPYLADGQVISADRVHAPTTVTDLAARVVDLMNQLHPESIGRLVDTFDRALAGTDAAVTTLQRSTDLLAATLLSRTASIRQLFSDLQAMGGDMDWLGPSLAAAGPELGKFGVTLNDIVANGAALAESRPVASYFTGDGLTPFLKSLDSLMAQIGPGLAPLGPALEPVVRDAVQRTPALDISALIGQALQGVGDDGAVHLRVGLK
ncbi:MCE family protein [Nocardia sp. ET3-3]|uniref:MCE family protein n=1 Tax=Nocardia terrae TaxID=2675851 RepID=A0A7K1UQS9_9NOCA|nr:MlaD family protein [Nocardia terrae]MVU76710.1 MCE family protein [Nocardia terrae]